MLLIPRRFAPLRKQLLDQGSPGLQVAPSAALRTLDAPLLGGDPQFVVSDLQQHFVPGIDPERPTEGSWDDKTPILAHTDTSLFHHGTL
jgi:hypothetical protein